MSHLQGFDENDRDSSSIGNGPVFSSSDNGSIKSTRSITDKKLGTSFFAKIQSRLFEQSFATKCWRDRVQKQLWILPLGFVLVEYIGLLLSTSISMGAFVWMLSRRDMKTDNWDEYRSINGQKIQNCRMELSRSLGTIGAPAIDWENFDSLTNIPDAALIEIPSRITTLLTDFLDAQTQLLLSIDEVSQCLRVSTSLHLGLGPHSQCVERVERASITRKNNRRRNVRNTNNSLGQLGATTSRLPLSIVRRNLTEQMIIQSESIFKLSNILHEQTINVLDMILLEEPLECPAVIDLAWIRDARQRLVNALGDCINLCASNHGLHILSINKDFFTRLEASMFQARNSKQYLAGLIAGIGTKHHEESTSTPLLSSLAKYHERLNALSIAIWSLEQCSPGVSPTSDQDDLWTWWEQIQLLSVKCREHEAEIRSHLFHPASGEEGNQCYQETNVDETQSMELSSPLQLLDEGEAPPPELKNQDRLPTKTVVFKGQGAKEERPAYVVKQKEGGGRYMHLPQRDRISERQMIQELQNRILIMRDDDDDDDSDNENDESMRSHQKSRLSSYHEGEPSAPVFLGASGSLLTELKMSLPTTCLSDQTEHEIVGEE